MNRREFLKSIGVACGLAVVAPAALLKPKLPEPVIINRPTWEEAICACLPPLPNGGPQAYYIKNNEVYYQASLA